MKINQISFKQDKNEVELNNKAVNVETLIPTPNNIIPTISLYDSDWVDALPVDIEGATSQVENYELPQKVPFEFSFNLEVPEVYLPFVNIAILAKPSTDQKVIGSGQFIFSSLREVLLTLYKWCGTTQTIQSGLGHAWWEYPSGPHVIPIPLPEPTMTIPPPTGCYERLSHWGELRCTSVGTGLGPFPISEDGTQIDASYGIGPIRVWILIHDWIDSLFAYYYPGGGGQFNFSVTTWQDVTFKHQVLHFPVPNDNQSTLPCGATTPPTGYPNQRWESEGQTTFQEYMNLGYSYAQAVAIFTKYYPELYITPEAHGIPYKCYQRVYNDIVESGIEKIKITKTDNKNFQFSVYGNLLLVSPANIETDWSDPDFPTFKPNSLALSTRLKVFFKNHPLNFIQTKAYR
jgi:hypothetical protein